MKQALVWIGAFIALGLVLTYWKLLVAIVVVGLLVWVGCVACDASITRRRNRLNGETARRSALAARAESQNQQYLAGEARGLYGNYQPKPLD